MGDNIGSHTFDSCYNLTSVVLPESAQSLGDYCFQSTGITTITIPSTVTNIGYECFYRCANLKNITINDGANYTIGTYAFSDCTSLTNDDVANIMAHCNIEKSINSSSIFSDCTSITEVSVPFLSDTIFSGCSELLKATSTEAYNVGRCAFRDCVKLEEVIIAEGTKDINYSVFDNCTALKTVYLPSSITNESYLFATNSNNIFYDCINLEEVKLGSDWSLSLRLSFSDNLTADSMVNMFNSLKDLTDATTKTLVLGSTNLAKLTDEQKAIAINKNWTLA